MTFLLEQRGLSCGYNVIIERKKGGGKKSLILRGATVYQKESILSTGG